MAAPEDAAVSSAAPSRRLAITAGAHVILRDLEGSQKSFRMTGEKDVRMGKYHPIPIDILLSVPYGATLRWTDGAWSRQRPAVLGVEDGDGDNETEVAVPTENNQHFKQDGSAQVLKPDDVSQMKKDLSGEEVVAAIAANSATFTSKTKFSKEKYIKKKQQKHMQQVTVLRPTLMDLCETYLKNTRLKVCGLRFDYLSSILCHAHIHFGGRYLVLDCAMGLVVGAMARQLAGHGRVFRLFSKGCSDKALLELDLTGLEKAVVSQVPIDVLASDDPLSQDWAQPPSAPLEESAGGASGSSSGIKPEVHAHRTQRAQRRREELQELIAAKEGGGGRGMDALVIVSGDEDKDVVSAAGALDVGLSRLGAGGRLVVYGHNLQPLAARQGAMKASGGWVDVRLVQLFTREFQVLPLRTHPLMAQEVNHCEGFLLVGTKVMEATDVGSKEPVTTVQEESAAKRQKLEP